MQLSLRELPKAQDAVFERGLLWFKAEGWAEEATAVTKPSTLPPPEPLGEAPLSALLSNQPQFMFVQVSKAQLWALWLQFNCLRRTVTYYSVVNK